MVGEIDGLGRLGLGASPGNSHPPPSHHDDDDDDCDNDDDI